MNHQLETRNRILQAALKLIKKGATTRAIAKEAGVYEVTLFRHFNNKQGLIEAIFQKGSYVPTLVKAIQERVTEELEQDLFMIAKLYQQLLKKNNDLIQCFWVSHL